MQQQVDVMGGESMPAETRQLCEPIETRMVLDLLASVGGVDEAGAGSLGLVELELDDDLSILRLWVAVVEEFGERSVGGLDLRGAWPTTLGEAAAVFAESLRR
jgi:hypothetical protein